MKWVSRERHGEGRIYVRVVSVKHPGVPKEVKWKEHVCICRRSIIAVISDRTRSGCRRRFWIDLAAIREFFLVRTNKVQSNRGYSFPIHSLGFGEPEMV